MSAQLLKLRTLCEQQTAQLSDLTPLKSANKTLTVKLMLRENELKSLKEDNEQQKKELERKNKLLAMFMNQRKGGLTEEEYNLLHSDEARAQEGNSDGEVEEVEEEEKKELPPTSVICVLCNRRLDEVINLKDKLIIGPPKLPAEAFRLMLPRLSVRVDSDDEEDAIETGLTVEEKLMEDSAALASNDGSGEVSTQVNPSNNKGEAASVEEEADKSEAPDSDEEDEKLPIVTNEKTKKITRMLSSRGTPAIIKSRGMDELWVFRTMRSILNSKLVEDSMLFSGSYTLQSGLGCRRTRFPEFVHSWFVPPQEQIEEVCDNVKNVHAGVSVASKTFRRAVQKDIEARERLFSEADDQRWALYYGVKSLAHRTPAVPEATLFWALLDETYQEDYMTFYCFCLQTLRLMCGNSLSCQYGATLLPHPPPNHYTLLKRTEGTDREKW